MAAMKTTRTIAKAVVEQMGLTNASDDAMIILTKKEFYDIERAWGLAAQYSTLRNHWVRFTKEYTFSTPGAPRVVLNILKLKSEFSIIAHTHAHTHESSPEKYMCVIHAEGAVE